MTVTGDEHLAFVDVARFEDAARDLREYAALRAFEPWPEMRAVLLGLAGSLGRVPGRRTGEQVFHAGDAETLAAVEELCSTRKLREAMSRAKCPQHKEEDA